MTTDTKAPTFRYQTSRLTLRGLEEADEALFCRLFCDADTMRFVGDRLTPKQACRLFNELLASAHGRPASQWFLVVVETSSQKAIGLCAISQFDEAMTRAEAGIMLESEARSRGYAREGLGGLVEATFASFPVREIGVTCSSLNPVVERMVSSIGFSLCDEHATGTGPLSLKKWTIRRD